jgi:hypothetical protein
MARQREPLDASVASCRDSGFRSESIMNATARRVVGPLTLATFLTLTLFGPDPARAETPRSVSAAERVAEGASQAERARLLRDGGNQAMLDMRYVDALALYEQSRALEPGDIGVEYSVARAHQLLGEFPEALSALERFDRRASPEVKARVGRLDQLFSELRSRVSTLQLKCTEKGARVLFRDKVIGVTPLESVRLPAGAGTLLVELDGFFPMSRDVVLPGGGTLGLEITLHARSRSSLLHVKTEPSGARVLVNGRAIGTSSPLVELVLPAGQHNVSARREGYDEASVPIVLKANSTRELTVSLERTVPVTSRWWFWTGAALVAAGGAALGYALLTEGPADQGTLSPGQVRAPLQLEF